MVEDDIMAFIDADASADGADGFDEHFDVLVTGEGRGGGDDGVVEVAIIVVDGSASGSSPDEGGIMLAERA